MARTRTGTQIQTSESAAPRDSQAIDATPRPTRGGPRTATGERPVTARIRERREAAPPELVGNEDEDTDEVAAVRTTEATPAPEVPPARAGGVPAAKPFASKPTGTPALGSVRKRRRRLF